MSDLQSALAFLETKTGARASSVREPKPKVVRVARLGDVRMDLPTLHARAIDRLAEKLNVPEEVVLDVTRISERTFHRRQSSDQPLTPTEADRVLRIARAASEAVRVFGDADKARMWLTAPSAILGDIPLHLLASDAGAREVEAELGRIDWGDFA